MDAFMMKLQKDFFQSFVEGNRWLQYVKGLGVTIKLTICALIIGLILGVLVAVIRSMYDQQSRSLGKVGGVLSFLNALCKIYTTVIRGTPMMVQLLIMYFVIFAGTRNQQAVAILAFGINSGAYVSEIMRGGIMSIDIGQMEAGRSLGFNFGQTMWHIIIPQAFKNILPSLVNEVIALVKETSIVTVIGLVDLTKAAILVQSKSYQALMPFIAIALVYLAIVMILTWLLGKLERRLRSSDH